MTGNLGTGKAASVTYVKNLLGLNPVDPTKVIASRIELNPGVHSLGHFASESNHDKHGGSRPVSWYWVRVCGLQVRYWYTLARTKQGSPGVSVVQCILNDDATQARAVAAFETLSLGAALTGVDVGNLSTATEANNDGVPTKYGIVGRTADGSAIWWFRAKVEIIPTTASDVKSFFARERSSRGPAGQGDGSGGGSGGTFEVK